MTSIIDPDLARRTLALIAPADDTFADLFAEYVVFTACTVKDGQLNNIQARTTQGMGLRHADHTHTRYVHIDGLSESHLQSLVQSIESGALPTRPASVPRLQHRDQPSMDAMVQVAREVAAEAERYGAPNLRAHVTIRSMQQRVLIARSDGHIAQDMRCYTKLSIDAILRSERKVRTSQRQAGAHQLADLCQNERHLELARAAAESALRRMEAVAVPTGEMTVILGPGGPATLLHEACGHALEADLARQPASAYYGCRGLQVASPLITLIDDPLAPEHASLYQSDDEGEPAQPTVLIERGILRNYLYDRCTALAERQAPNGHGRRLNYAYPPMPRMSTTVVAAGESDAGEIIAETRRGLFVQSISGGDTDMGSGRFNLQVNEGYLIEDGRIGASIRGAVLSGHGPTVLRSIDRVGKDCAFVSYCYVCNKLNQFPLVVSVGQPTLRVPRLLVWGG
jgi:TldD protein